MIVCFSTSTIGKILDSGAEVAICAGAPVMELGKSGALITDPEVIAQQRSRQFSSSRTFPGQS
jgi:hypothetical protein